MANAHRLIKALAVACCIVVVGCVGFPRLCLVVRLLGYLVCSPIIFPASIEQLARNLLCRSSNQQITQHTQ